MFLCVCIRCKVIVYFLVGFFYLGVLLTEGARRRNGVLRIMFGSRLWGTKSALFGGRLKGV